MTAAFFIVTAGLRMAQDIVQPLLLSAFIAVTPVPVYAWLVRKRMTSWMWLFGMPYAGLCHSRWHCVLASSVLRTLSGSARYWGVTSLQRKVAFPRENFISQSEVSRRSKTRESSAKRSECSSQFN